ncbi:hypothetical protein RSOL_005830, partial [Rhizoctonia solani AG-3 Rhs1AP]
MVKNSKGPKPQPGKPSTDESSVVTETVSQPVETPAIIAEDEDVPMNAAPSVQTEPEPEFTPAQEHETAQLKAELEKMREERDEAIRALESARQDSVAARERLNDVKEAAAEQKERVASLKDDASRHRKTIKELEADIEHWRERALDAEQDCEKYDKDYLSLEEEYNRYKANNPERRDPSPRPSIDHEQEDREFRSMYEDEFDAIMDDASESSKKPRLIEAPSGATPRGASNTAPKAKTSAKQVARKETPRTPTSAYEPPTNPHKAVMRRKEAQGSAEEGVEDAEEDPLQLVKLPLGLAKRISSLPIAGTVTQVTRSAPMHGATGTPRKYMR